ncbi:MAG: polyketide cyclase [Aquabacterium sp.]|uniref:SRPBCC domain-containing protein n=1 Tax=Aquabacterium sp. TaxID=1872578 RepID=UPI00122A56E8|nr:SRPBCC domain-containing protein [Aquabacterium sp.]TAK96202.1 MAG: polyketide cyclase [Aquabacterium sp.]
MITFSTTRTFGATPAEVFAAIQDGERLARWWGPEGFSNQFDVFEFQPDGRWVFDMIGPDGKTYPNEAVFARIESDKQVVIQHVCAPHFQLSITLTPSPNGTLLMWDQTFEDAAVGQAIRHIVVPANEQNLDRLGQELARCASTSSL